MSSAAQGTLYGVSVYFDKKVSFLSCGWCVHMEQNITIKQFTFFKKSTLPIIYLNSPTLFPTSQGCAFELDNDGYILFGVAVVLRPDHACVDLRQAARRRGWTVP